jgi:hypothetical protein
MIVRIEGYREFLAGLRRLGETEARKEMVAEFRSVARVVAADAQRRAPRRSGRLASNIKARGGQSPAVVLSAAAVPYGKVHEFGGRHPVYGKAWVYQPARPFIGPAVDAAHGLVLDAAEAALNKALTRTGWK